jgi:hypothetical protein
MSSYRSHVVAPSRVFDHLYDPNFITSSSKTIYRENCVALARSAPIHVHPSDNSMFSELHYEQRNYYVYQKNVLPHLPPICNDSSNTMVSVTGIDRSKFFSTPACNSKTISVGLLPTVTSVVDPTRYEIDITKSMQEQQQQQLQMRTKSTSIQTIFR